MKSLALFTLLTTLGAQNAGPAAMPRALQSSVPSRSLGFGERIRELIQPRPHLRDLPEASKTFTTGDNEGGAVDLTLTPCQGETKRKIEQALHYLANNKFIPSSDYFDYRKGVKALAQNPPDIWCVEDRPKQLYHNGESFDSDGDGKQDSVYFFNDGINGLTPCQASGMVAHELAHLVEPERSERSHNAIYAWQVDLEKWCKAQEPDDFK